MIGVMENKKISNKKKQKTSFSDGMMSEVLNDKMDLIIEGQTGTNESIDALSGRFSQLEDKVMRLEVKSMLTEEHLVGLKGKLIKVDGKLDKLDKKFDGLAGDLRRKADKEAIVALGHRVEKIEAIQRLHAP